MTGKFAQNGLAYRSSDEKNTAAIWKKGMGYRSSDEKNQKKRLAFFGFFRGWGQAQERRQEKGTGRSREAHSRVVRYLQAAL